MTMAKSALVDNDTDDDRHDDAKTYCHKGQHNHHQHQHQHHHQQPPLAIFIGSANIGNAEPTRESFAAWIPRDGEFILNPGGGGSNNSDNKEDEAIDKGMNNTYCSSHCCCCCCIDDENEFDKEINDDNDVDDDDDNTITKNKKKKQKQKFDIIVIGMQEAAFIYESNQSSSKDSNDKSEANDNDNGSNNKNDNNNTKMSKRCVVVDDDDYNDAIYDDANDRAKEEGVNNDEGIRDCGGEEVGAGAGVGGVESTITTTSTCGVLLDMVNDGVTELRKGSEQSGKRVIQNIGRGNLFIRGLGISSPNLLPRTIMNKAPTVRDLTSPFATRNRPNTDDDANIITTTTTTNATSRTTSSASAAATTPTWLVNYDTKKLLELITDRLPSYDIISYNLRGQMRLYVLALKSLVNEIVDVRVAGENTGLGSVLANKGGTIATMTVRDTRLSFMNAHLAAHEGPTNYANRNRSLQQILAGARTDPFYNMHDASIISHHMFICGDLNYRINFDISHNRRTMLYGKGESPAYGNTASNGQHFDKAMEFIDAKDWNSLAASDELTMALRRKECLAGFTTLPCDFPCTFKVKRGEGYRYNEARTPSYTDRILWKSADGLADSVEPILYEPCPGFITSDHKPIRGGYLVNTISGNPLNQSPPLLKTHHITTKKNHDRKVHLLISDIKCTGLPVMDSLSLGGLCDPYIQFMSYPKSLLYTTNKTWPSTKVIKRTLNPVWKEVVHVSLNQDPCNNTKNNNQVGDNLAGAMLYLTVMDDDYSIDNEVVGTVALNLADLCSNLYSPGPLFAVHRTEIKRPILRNGQEFGMLECTISSAYCSAKEDKAFVNSAMRVHKSKTRMNLFQQAVRKVRSFSL